MEEAIQMEADSASASAYHKSGLKGKNSTVL